MGIHAHVTLFSSLLPGLHLKAMVTQISRGGGSGLLPSQQRDQFSGVIESSDKSLTCKTTAMNRNAGIKPTVQQRQMKSDT